MKKIEYLKNALKKAGMRGNIHESLKSMTHDNGFHYAGILRSTDSPERAKSKKTFRDQQDVPMLRKKYFDVTCVYNVVICDRDEESLEDILENFMVNLGKGFDDGNGNWVGTDIGTADWVDEEDSVLKARLAVEIPITLHYGIYEDVRTAKMPSGAEIQMGVIGNGSEKDGDG